MISEDFAQKTREHLALIGDWIPGYSKLSSAALKLISEKTNPKRRTILLFGLVPLEESFFSTSGPIILIAALLLFLLHLQRLRSLTDNFQITFTVSWFGLYPGLVPFFCLFLTTFALPFYALFVVQDGFILLPFSVFSYFSVTTLSLLSLCTVYKLTSA